MNDETTIVTKSESTRTTAPSAEDSTTGDSKVLDISVRAWIALIFVFTVCYMAAFGKTVEEPLYSLSVMAVGFYFGQVKQPKQTP